MATELCQKCKQAHPGRSCDYDDKGTAPRLLTSMRSPKYPTRNSKTRKMWIERNNLRLSFSQGWLDPADLRAGHDVATQVSGLKTGFAKLIVVQSCRHSSAGNDKC